MTANKKIINMAQFAILMALEAIVCFTPLGSLPALGPIVATLMMIPVIITSVLMGTKYGTIMGFLAGLFSFLVWTFIPPSPLVAFAFTPFYSLGEFQGNFGSVLICFVPRILAGMFSSLIYSSLQKKLKDKQIINMSISAIVGSMTNTLLVMFGIFLFFGEQYASVAGQAMLLIIGSTVLTSGIPEAIVAAVVVSAVCIPVKKVMAKMN